MLTHGRDDHAAASCRAVQVEADAVADEQLAAERAEEDQPLHDADEPRREVGALQRVARVLQAAEQERDEADGERVVARERRDHDPRVAVAGGVGRAGRACGGSRRPGLRRRCRRSRRRAPSPRGSSGACACRRSARRAASRRSPAPRTRSACACRAPRRGPRPRRRPAARTAARASRRAIAGQLAASGRFLPCGNTFAVGLDVSRQYDCESKIR